MSPLATYNDMVAAEASGLVYRSERDGLVLFHYTAAAAFSRSWSPATIAARGIVFDAATRKCVARPFPKFFNLGEMPFTMPDALPVGLQACLEEKVDGSLGILFYHDGAWRITTKGALGSEQAVYAAEVLLPRVRGLGSAPIDYTFLAEIVFPGNRIVVDYGQEESLRLLAGVHLHTGVEMAPGIVALSSDLYGFGRIRREFVSPRFVRSIRDIEHEDNTEGFVLRFAGPHASTFRVKIKSARYVEIHRLLGAMNPRRVLEMIADGRHREIAEKLPPGLSDAFDDLVADLTLRIERVEWEALKLYHSAEALLPDRKAFALAVKDHPYAAVAFAVASGKNVREAVLRIVARGLSGDESGGDTAVAEA